ncbi:transcriptional regulator [Streptomyces sp. H39-C1]|uniref:transcriptional regulator n=1 Tax=Streptomyces sp. H39-C1 TaxID=3004355 RepID=UPI0022AFA662|nr:transcriptional regulator [Streptomyces sp. H39-C1]MCZ4103670.1 transcriptional regulator [Streptomyces sp. H39-C1]
MQAIGVLASVAGVAGGYYAWRALDDPTVKASQARFRAVRIELRESVGRLAHIAADLHTDAAPALERIGSSALLADATMRPASPLPISRIRLVWADSEPPEDRALTAAARRVLPKRTRWSRYTGYAEALESLMRPALFDNRPAFRLLEADWRHADGPLLTFGRGRYFDLVDQGEAMTHELAQAAGRTAAAPAWRRMPLHALLKSDPLSLSRRVVIPSIGTLTVRRTAAGQGTFFLLYRSPGQSAHGEGTYSVIPGGIFQPASLSPVGYLRDLNLWHNIMREYNEEMLGAAEATGEGGVEVDYTRSPYSDFEHALSHGHLRVWCFGMGVEAQNLVPCLLTIAVFNADVFDTIFTTIVDSNDEGILVSGPRSTAVTGLPLEEGEVRHVLASPQLAPIAAALLHLALQHRTLLLGDNN